LGIAYAIAKTPAFSIVLLFNHGGSSALFIDKAQTEVLPPLQPRLLSLTFSFFLLLL